MPVTKSAKKKLRVDRKKESGNKKIKSFLKKTLKKAEAKPNPKTINEAFSIIDKGVKKNIIHKNKASRLKAKLSRLLKTKTKKE